MSKAVQMADKMPLLEVQNISFSYRNKRLLENISFSIYDNEELLLLGVSGSGKSLLIEKLAGNLKTDGKLVRSPSLRKHDLTFSFDTFATFTLLKIGEVINLLSQIYKCAANASLIDQLRLNEIMDRKVQVLSKGERKRLGVYCALFSDPKLAVLDEPTDGMDPVLREAFWNIIKSRNGSALISTHQWEEAQAMHDRIALIAGGRLLTPPMSFDDLSSQIPFTGKIVTRDDPILDNSTFARIVINEKSFLYFANDEEKANILDFLQQSELINRGYSVLPIEIIDVYHLLSERG